ncbi:MAG: UbiX family flavin prenyltransferase [Candidatus Marsarchaeota archaeon]|nr:UbiX family flavin prenyltransferase [Candidatus Marsarchaeota archaeon]MCL5412909.1 UbiX family flavin prenyltransferase [Candidatus Marsarchaeota archaeon]
MKRLAVCVTGASGVALPYLFLKEASKSGGVETHLVVSKSGGLVIKQELGISVAEFQKYTGFSYDEKNFMAPIASGSFRLDGVLVSPCSMKTLSGIANGYEDNLIIRCASIALKEKWRLVLMPRETPLSVIHIRNMLSVAEAGAMVFPPMPQFYFRPRNVEDMIRMTVGKMLSIFGIDSGLSREWGSDKAALKEFEPQSGTY